VVKPGRTITEVIERVRGLVSEYTDGQQVPGFHNNLPGDYYFINHNIFKFNFTKMNRMCFL
jgi:hypothetical protein